MTVSPWIKVCMKQILWPWVLRLLPMEGELEPFAPVTNPTTLCTKVCHTTQSVWHDTKCVTPYKVCGTTQSVWHYHTNCVARYKVANATTTQGPTLSRRSAHSISVHQHHVGQALSMSQRRCLFKVYGMCKDNCKVKIFQVEV